MPNIRLVMQIKRNVSVDALSTKAKRAANKVTRQTCMDIRDEYRATARRETGAQAASAYVVAPGYNDYSRSINNANLLRPNAEPIIREDIENIETGYKRVPNVGTVGVAMPYAALNEYGTTKTPGDGAFTKAVSVKGRNYANDVAGAIINEWGQ